MNTSPACKSLSPACQRGESLIAIGDIINTIGHITYNSAHDQWPDGLTRGELTTAFDSLESAVAHARALHLGPVGRSCCSASPSAMDCGGSETPLSTCVDCHYPVPTHAMRQFVDVDAARVIMPLCRDCYDKRLARSTPLLNALEATAN